MEEITFIFTLVIGVPIGVLFLFDLFSYYRQSGKNHKDFKNSMVSLGIIGTFLGIYFGLQDMNLKTSDAIEAGIPGVIDGLTGAFLTSIIGLGASFLSGLIQISIPSKYGSKGDPVADVVVENLNGFKSILEKNESTYDKVHKILDRTIESNTKVQESLDKNTDTNEAVLGAIESNRTTNENVCRSLEDLKEKNEKVCTYLEDTQKSNKEVVSNVGEMKATMDKTMVALDKTLEKITEGANKAIIESLESVIKDFNQNLTEQFGDNFKELNKACKELLEWQKQYKVSIKESNKALNTTVEIVGETKAAMDNTTKAYKEALPKLEEFHEVVGEVGEGVSSLSEGSKGLATNIENFSSAIDKFEADSKRALSGVSAVTDKFDELNQSVQTQIKAIEDLVKNQEKVVSEMENTLKGQTKISETIREEMQKTLKEFQIQVNTAMNATHQELGSSLQEMVRKFGDVYSASVDYLKRSQENLNKINEKTSTTK